MRKFTGFVVLLLLLCVWAAPAAAAERYTNPVTGYRAVIEDEEDLLSKMEELQLLSAMKPLTENTNIAFCSVYASSSQNGTKSNAEDAHIRLFGDGVNGLVFMIDMRSRYMFLDTEGWAQQVIPKSAAEIITNNIRTDMSAGRYYEASLSVMRQIQSKINGEKIAEPMRYLSAAVIGIMNGLLFALLLTISKRGEVNTLYSREAVWASVGFFGGALTAASPKAIVHEYRKYSPRSSCSSCSSCSSGSSGGGGGHSCGGSSSGGGGGGGGGHSCGGGSSSGGGGRSCGGGSSF